MALLARHILLEATKVKSILNVSVLVLVVLGLGSSAWHILHMDWINAMVQKIIDISMDLTSPPLLLSANTMVTLRHYSSALWHALSSGHIWRVAQLSLLVLEVGIVDRVGT